MKFGIREICDVVFKAKAAMTIGSTTFVKGQPVLYIDTAKASTLESSATTVYATGGKGNTNLIAWEGEKKLTFTVEDALLSPIGFAILSGAGLFKTKDKKNDIHIHKTASATVVGGQVDLSGALMNSEKICKTAPIFVMEAEADGSIKGAPIEGLDVCNIDTHESQGIEGFDTAMNGKTVFVDFYVVKNSSDVSELQIDASSFSGNFYVEASTLFRRQEDGKDLPAEITIPNVKIQSNFNFNMAATGDPSTFSFVMDAFPGYTTFNNSKKVLCVIQIVDDSESDPGNLESVMKHKDDEVVNAYEEGTEETNDKTEWQVGYKDSVPNDTDTKAKESTSI